METPLTPAVPAIIADSSVYGYRIYVAARITITAADSNAAAHATRTKFGQYDVFVDFTIQQATRLAPTADTALYRSKDATMVRIYQSLDETAELTLYSLNAACNRAAIYDAAAYCSVYDAMLEQFALFSNTRSRREWLALNRISINDERAYQAVYTRPDKALLAYIPVHAPRLATAPITW